jgi:hypothetical protein
MDDREPSDRPVAAERPPTPTGNRGAAPATAAACHPDVVCPVCTARGKSIQMVPVKAHYQCPECRYFDSCCM